jgi:hypothetical protein
MYEDARLRPEDIAAKVLTTLDVSTANFNKASA